jgi:hypothetical protein
MAISEPGGLDADAVGNAPPELPERPPERFQFSLKQLLAFMFASAVVAAGLRYFIQYVQALPDHEQTALANYVVCGLAFGGLAYFFLRGPFLAVRLSRFRDRWREIQRHRRELHAWGEARKREQRAPADVPREK